MKLNDYVMIHMCILLLFGALVFPQAAMANKNNNEIALNELHKSIEATLKKYEIPAFAYAIVSQGKRPVVEVFGQHASFGHTNPSSTPITINTPFRLASISKLIVGIAVMQHIERGTLSLDDRLDNLLPWLIYKNSYKDTHPILLKHLLEHTTGWDETSLKERAAGNEGSLSIQDILSISADSRKSRWQPGTRHAYTNTTATVVAAIIEKVSGQSFYDYVASEIFTPLQIGSATYNESNVQMPLGHRGKRSVPYQHIVMEPSGALAMSIVDMAKLANEFVAERSRLLNSSSLTRMTLSTSTNAGNFKAGYGIFNYARYYNGIPYRGHDGALPGWLAEFSYSPNNKVGFVVMQNSENGRAFRSIVELIHTFISKHNETKHNETPTITAVKSEDNRLLSGYYRMINPRFQARWFLERLMTSHHLQANEEQATLRSVFPKGWTRTLFHIGDGTWVNPQNEVVMKLANDPELGEVLHYGDRVFKKESALFALLDKFILASWLLLFVGFLFASIVWLVKMAKRRFFPHKNNVEEASAEIGRKQRKNIMLAVLVSLVFSLFLVLGMLSPVERLGNVSVFSLGLLVSSVLFFVGTFYCTFAHIKYQALLEKRVLFLLGLCFLLMQICVVVYLLYFGVIGVTTWQ